MTDFTARYRTRYRQAPDYELGGGDPLLPYREEAEEEARPEEPLRASVRSVLRADPSALAGFGPDDIDDTEMLRDTLQANRPRPQGERAFTVNPLTEGQIQGLNDYMGRQRRGRLTLPEYEANVERITGRRDRNAGAIVAYFNRTGHFVGANNAEYVPEADTQRALDRMRRQDPSPGADELFEHGAVSGLSDQASGLGNIIVNAVRAPFTDEDLDPARAYLAGRDARNLYLAEARDNAGMPGAIAEIAGGMGAIRPGASMLRSRAAPFGRRVREGFEAGAATGLLSGLGYSQDEFGVLDPGGAARDALESTATGAGAGIGVPLAAKGAGTLGDAFRAWTGRDRGTSLRIIERALRGDGATPGSISGQLQQGWEDGVPTMLADNGDNGRRLLAQAAQRPGETRDAARAALAGRQAGLPGRLRGAIERDLGPVQALDQTPEALLAEAQRGADARLRTALERPGSERFARGVRHLFVRPSLRPAMQRARALAEQDGLDPQAIGLIADDAGHVVLGRETSWQTMDYVRRGMDDAIEARRDPASGRLALDRTGVAVRNAQRAFIDRLDAANPDYAAALEAWPGAGQARTALAQGRRALDGRGTDISTATSGMTRGERRFYEAGLRQAMAERAATIGEADDPVRALIGSDDRRLALQRLFGGRRGLDRFLGAVRAEQAGWQSFDRIMPGSPPAPGGQAGLVGRYAAEPTRREIVSILTENRPESLWGIGRELSREAASRRGRQRLQLRMSRSAGRFAGNYSGRNQQD